MQRERKNITVPSRLAGELVSALGVDSSRCTALTLRLRIGRAAELTVVYRQMVDGAVVERLQRLQLCAEVRQEQLARVADAEAGTGGTK